MRPWIAVLSVFALLVAGLANAMHVHSGGASVPIALHASAMTDDSSGATKMLHAASCHACAHQAPTLLTANPVQILAPAVDRPHSTLSSMFTGGAWPPLRKPPR